MQSCQMLHKLLTHYGCFGKREPGRVLGRAGRTEVLVGLLEALEGASGE